MVASCSYFWNYEKQRHSRKLVWGCFFDLKERGYDSRMKKSKIALYISLLVVIFLCVIKLNVLEVKAEGTEYVDSNKKYRYSVNSDNTITILGFTDDYRDNLYSLNLSKLVIPSKIDGRSVSTIGEEAFMYCYFGQDCVVEIPEGITKVERQAFYGATMKKLIIPSTVGIIGIWDYTFSYMSAEEIKVSPNNQYLCDYNGILCEKGLGLVYTCPEKYKKTRVELPSQTSTLACASFGNTNVKELIFPNPEAQFFTYTFYGCNIKVYGVKSRVDYWRERKANGWPEGNVTYEVLSNDVKICLKSGHSWDSGKITKAATCTTDGVKTFTCSRCKTTKTESIRATSHNWNSGKTTKAATCTTKGVKTYTCTKCNSTKTEDIPATGHKSVADAAVAATCTKAGKTAGSHCSVCGTVITAQQTIKATGHSWDSGKVTTKPTTSSAGIKTYTCTKCKATKTETIPKLIQEKKVGVAYTTHVQSIGWQSLVRNGDLAGTVGDGKRLEAIKINLENAPYSGNIEYRTHVQTYGWQGWVKNGALSGTSGQAKRLEAIQIRLTGEMANYYDVYYRIQVQSFGWLGWAKNGEYSGSAGYAKRLEAIQIVLVEKGKSIDKNTLNKQGKITSSTKVTEDTAYVTKTPSIEYQTHIQSIGWQGRKVNGEMSGTSGQAKRLEGIKINLSKPPYDGGIRYKTHVQSYGWQGWKYDGEMSGTSGQAKRLEAISIELTGEMAKHYDVYYRVHAQSYGWLGWASNGQPAGTAGYSKRLEGIQIILVPKGSLTPDRSFKGIYSDHDYPYIEMGMVAPTLTTGGGGGSFYRPSDNIGFSGLPDLDILGGY